MIVLLAGAGGQVGRAVLEAAPARGVEVVGLDRAGLDVTDAAAVRAAVEAHRPDVVLNAAAYTAVDRAEAEPDRAFAVNRDGARHLAEAAEAAGVPIVHISTDYVFGGDKGAPYAPDDERAPVNVYGASKAAGEVDVAAVTDRFVTLRTAWVFSAGRENFVTTMLRLGRDRRRLRVVADQWGHPTAAADVAAAALSAAAAARDGLSGTFHAAGLPLTTWHGLATAALEARGALEPVPPITIDPIPTEDYPTPAARPRRVELELMASFDALGIPPIDWRKALSRVVREWSRKGSEP